MVTRALLLLLALGVGGCSADEARAWRDAVGTVAFFAFAGFAVWCLAREGRD